MATQSSSTLPPIHEIAYVHETAIAWANLPEDEVVLILAPIIPLAEASSNGIVRSRNPFEDLQRALASFHPGEVRLVDYDPMDGLEDRHSEEIDECPTLLLIICEPAGLDPSSRQELLDEQVAFAEDAMSEYSRIHEGTEPDAIIALYCGQESYTAPEGINMCLRVDDCTSEHWAALGKWLFAGD